MSDRDERPYLACCERAEQYRLMRLSYPSQSFDELLCLGEKIRDRKPQWCVSVRDHDQTRLYEKHRSIRRGTRTNPDGETYHTISMEYGDMPPIPAPVDHCPFCGKKVPEVVKYSCPPPWIRIISDGGYYCDTCGERLMSCGCSPPETLWHSPGARSDQRRWAAVWLGRTESTPGHYLGTMTPQMRSFIENQWWDYFDPEKAAPKDGSPEHGRLSRDQNEECFDELLEAQKSAEKAKELIARGTAPVLSWHD